MGGWGGGEGALGKLARLRTSLPSASLLTFSVYRFAECQFADFEIWSVCTILPTALMISTNLSGSSENWS